MIHADQEKLAAKTKHTSVVRGDHAGYDILSFESHGAERLIEVKTTWSGLTPRSVMRVVGIMGVMNAASARQAIPARTIPRNRCA